MNLVDSSGWIEYFAGSPSGRSFVEVIQDFDQILVSTINIYEVAKRMSQQYGQTELLQNLTLMRRGRIVPLDEPIALDAVQLAIAHKLPMADSMILATAYMYNATLWTQDAHFAGITGVQYIPKV